MTTPPKSRLGSRLRELRKSKGLTLKEMSEKVGISYSTLSKVENNKLSLTYEKLFVISRRLEIDIRLLFDAQVGLTDDSNLVASFPTRRSVSRRFQGRAVETDAFQVTFLFEELINKRLSAGVMKLKARTIEKYGGLVRHAGEEIAIVLEGSVTVHTQYYKPETLKKGDSIYLDSAMGHAYLAAGDEDVIVYVVCSGDMLDREGIDNSEA